jgi:PAS domain S-box-containing protein
MENGCGIEDMINGIVQRIEGLLEDGAHEQDMQACLEQLKQAALSLQSKLCSEDACRLMEMGRWVETSPTAIVLTDLEGRIEYVNSSLVKGSGFQDSSEVKGLSIFDFTSEEGKSKLVEEILPALHSRGQWQGELPLLSKGGQTFSVEMICSLVRDDLRRPAHLLANFFNITDRKRAEEALLLDDSRLEALQRLSQMDESSLQEITDFALEAGVKLTGSKLGYMAFVDDQESTLIMHSWSRAAMQECHVGHKRLIYPLKDTGLWGEAVRQRRAVITNDYASCPQKKGTPPGHVNIVRHMNVPILDRGKVVIVAGLGNKDGDYDEADVRQLTLLMSGMWRILQRRAAEEALQESQRALSTLMSNLPGMAYRCKNDRQWTMQFVSDGCLELTGWLPGDLLDNKSLSFADLIHSGDQNYVWNEVQEALAERRPFCLTYRLRTRSGIKWVWEQGQGIFDGQGELLALEGFVSDITERKMAEDTLKKAQEDLERRVTERTEWLVKSNSALQEEMVKHRETEWELRAAQQAADAASRAKSEFLANMSHEIRTPMNAVIGLAGLLLETELTPEQRDFVETIHSSGDALLAIINDILDFSKIDEGKMKLERLPFLLRESIEASCRLVAARAGQKGLSLSYAIDGSLPPAVLGDPARLRQVLANLLSNAVKFTEKGSIFIRVQPGEKKDDLLFSVSDTGIGISPEDRQKLFLSFSQVDASTSRKYGGTGLGLAISRRLVELMGGRIWVESELDAGSTFYFQIKAEPSYVDPARGRLAGKRIMALIGREEMLRELAELARSSAVQIFPVAHSQEAREMDMRRFDAAVLDLDVPGAEELAAELQIHLPVIIVAPPDDRRRDSYPIALSGVQGSIGRELEALLSKDSREWSISRRGHETSDLDILLAEDNAVNQKVARLMLKKLGFGADVVSNGREVLSALAKKDYDVILMDVQMPEMDGLEATRAILKSRPERRPKILAMTAYALEGDREKCLEAGMDGYISKPVQIEELKRALQDLQRQKKEKPTLPPDAQDHLGDRQQAQEGRQAGAGRA